VPPGATAPRVGDGKTYSRGLGWQSPEGNFYGQTRFVRDWRRTLIWNGREYTTLELAGVVQTVSELPAGPRPFMQAWGVPKANWPPAGQDVYDGRPYDIYFWNSDTDAWAQVVWLWEIDDVNDIPYPGNLIGGAHVIIDPDVEVFWDGYVWRKFRHSAFEDDQPTKHLPEGFIAFLTPDVKIEYYNKKQLSLDIVKGGSGTVLVNGEIVNADPQCSVFNTCPALDLTANVITPVVLAPDTEYWIYLVNTASSAFNVLETETTIAWDFRGKLFLSLTPPIDGYMAATGVGVNAVVAGFIETDSDCYFRHELDISWISRRPNLQETFRDYSDFYLSYEGTEELRLTRMDGSFGQIYIPEELIYIGDGKSVYNNDPWVSIDGDELPVYHDTALTGNTEYWIYIVNEVDAINFNEINPKTGKPFRRTDVNAVGNYDERKDLQLKPFLSTKEHEHFRLTESWPLFYSRCIGHVWTDANGRFLYAKDISYIKSLILNPTHFKGQADFAIKPDSSTQFKVAETEGTAGVVYVGGETLITLPSTDSDVHIANVSDYFQTYTESNISAPLSNISLVSSQHDTIFYVYMANNETCWGARANKLFFSKVAPTRGYLSANWPGTSARWVATVKTDSSGLLTGYWLLDSPGKQDAALLNLNDIAMDLGSLASIALSQDSFINFLLGIGSFNVGLFDSLSDDLSMMYSIASDLRSDVSELLDDVSDLGTITVDIGSDITDLYSNASALSNNVSALGSNLDAMESNVEDIYSDIDDLYSDVSGAYDNISDMGSNFNEISDNVSDIQSNVTALFSDLSGAQSNLSGLYSAVSDFSGNLSILDSAIDGAYSNASNIVSNLSDITGDVSDLQSEFSGMGDDISDMGSYIDNISENASNIGSNVEALFSNLSATDSYADQLESYVGDLSGELTDLTSLYSDIGSELVSNVWSNISNIEDNVSDIISDVSIINSTLSDIWEEASSISDVVSDINTNIGDIYSDVSAASGTINSLYSIFSNFSGDLYSATSFLSDANSLMSNNVWSNVSGIYSELGNLSHGFDMLGSADTQISNNISLLASTLRSEAASNFTAVSLRVNSLSTNLSATISNLNILSGNISATGSNFNTLSGQLSGLGINLNNISLHYNSLVSDVGAVYSNVSNVQSHISDYLSDISAADGNIIALHSYTSEFASNVSEDMGSLYSNLSNLQSDTDVMSLDIVDLFSSASGLSNTLLSLRSNVSAMSGDVSNLYSNFSAISQTYSALSGSVSGLGSNVNKLSNYTISLQSDYASLSYWTSNVNSNLQTLSGRVSNLSGNLVSVASDINAADSYLIRLHSYVSDFGSELSGLDSNLGALYSDVSLLSGNINSLSILTSDLGSNYNTLSNRVSNVSGNLTSLSGNLSLLSGNLSNLTSSVSGASLVINSLWSTYSNVSLITNSLSTNISATQSNLTLLSGNVNSLSGNLSGLSNTYSTLSGRLSNVSNVMSNLSVHESALSANVAALSGNLNTASLQVTSLWSTYSNISLITNSLSTNISGIQSTASLLSGNVGSLSLNLSGLGNNYNSLSNHISNVSRTLSNLSGNVNSLSGNLSNATSNLNALSGNLNSTASTISNLSGDWNSLSNKVSLVSQRMGSLTSDLNALDSALDTTSLHLQGLELNLQSGYVGDMSYLITYDWIGKRFKYEDQKSAGLPIRLNYADTYYFTLSPMETNAQIVFENGSKMNLVNGSTLHFHLDNCSLSAGSFYYIYLKVPAAGQDYTLGTEWVNPAYWYVTTAAPDKHYTVCGSRDSSGNKGMCDSMLIGYISVVSTNRMGGNWNLWSLYHQPEQYWDVNITNSATISSSTMIGFLRPDVSVECNVLRTGSSRGLLYFYITGYGYVVCYTDYVVLGNSSKVDAYLRGQAYNYVLSCNIPLADPSGWVLWGSGYMSVSVTAGPAVGMSNYSYSLYQTAFNTYLDSCTGTLRLIRTPPVNSIVLF
jgi:chromosome segregation ATPase